MPSLYLNEYGATLGLVNDRLHVRRNGKLIQEIPALHLERVVLVARGELQGVGYAAKNRAEPRQRFELGKLARQRRRNECRTRSTLPQISAARAELAQTLAAFEQRFQESKYWSAPQDSGDPVGGMEGQVRQLVRVLLDKQKQYAAIKTPE